MRCNWCQKDAEFSEVTGDPSCWQVHACAEHFEIWVSGLDPTDSKDEVLEDAS